MTLTESEWITIGAVTLGLLILIKFGDLKVWQALLVFGGGFWFATTPAGLYILAHVISFITKISHG